MDIERFESDGPFSQVTVTGDTVYLAGQVARDWDGSVEQQTREVLAEIDRLLQLAGSSRAGLLSVNVYLADIADFKAMNAVWAEWVQNDAKPVRATIEAKLAFPELLVEMQAIAQRTKL